MKSHRIVTVAGTVMFGALLLGAPEAAAAPPPVNQPRVVATAANPGPLQPRTRPEIGTPPTVVVADPCTDCTPDEPADDPATPATEPDPADAPTDSSHDSSGSADDSANGSTSSSTGGSTGGSAAEPSGKPVDQPRSAPAGVPTPTRIDTGEGPGDPGAPVNWLLIGLPALALLGLAAGGAYVWITRSERSAR
jgi:hypothetical protein